MTMAATFTGYRDTKYYTDLFEVSVGELDAVIARAMSSGAGYADLYFENSVYRSLLLRDGQVTSTGSHVDYGVGIRALDGEKTGYSFCETTALPHMLRGASAAAAICRCTTGHTGTRTSAGRMDDSRIGALAPHFQPPATAWGSVETAELVRTLTDLDTALRRRDPRIQKVVAGINSCEHDVMMYNSAGQLVCDSRPIGRIVCTIVFSDGKVTESRSAGRSFRKGAEMLANAAGEIEDELVGGIDAMLQAGRPKGGKMSVVMGAGASGILLHEAMGHAFEADFNRKGQSIFCDRMGRRICPKGINIVDDGTWEGNRGASGWDDEGIPQQKTYMVTDGVLTSYLHDRISAGFYGVEPTGNGMRESFRYNPLPRMRLTYMESGDTSPQDMIASVRKGVYVSEFSNGQVKIGEGDFTFYVKSGFLIENGRLTRPVKDINVVGNGPQALADIVAVGNDLKIDNGAWTCGKEQSVPVGCGMPTVLVRELTVGGE